jgi:hypothetical protein
MSQPQNSNPTIKVKHAPQARRIVAGASVVVVGVVLFRSYSEAIGLFLILVGVAIGIRRSLGPIFVAIYGTAIFALILAVMYSTVSDEYRFEEWLRYKWWVVLYPAFFVLWPLYSSRKQSADAWAILTADYSGEPEALARQRHYPAVNGYLKLDEEMIFVYVSATESGVLIVREDEGNLFFPWEKIKSIRVSGDAVKHADVEISRRSMLPLSLNIPWFDDFTIEIPTTVQVFGG